jgi:hypothetical protein
MSETKPNESENSAAPHDLWAELATVKIEVLKRIQLLAQQSDTDGLIKANDWLRTCISVEKKHSALLNEASEVVLRGRGLAVPQTPGEGIPRESQWKEPDEFDEADNDSEPGEEITGGKARGRQCRSAFVTREAERGSPLRRVSGQLFRNPAGALVGIAYAAEREKRKNTWFLGLPADKFQAVVLLCESLNGKILVFRLPQNFVHRYGRHLSVSKQFSQAKFRLDKRDGRFELSTAVGAVDVSEFLDAEPLVCPKVSGRAEYV